MIDPVVLDEQMFDTIEYSKGGADPWREVDGCLPGGHGCARVQNDDSGRVRPLDPVQDPCPLDGLCAGHVMPDKKDAVGRIVIRIRSGLAVCTEGLAERGRGGGGTEPGVTVSLTRAEPRLGNDGKGVIFFDEDLAGAVERDRITGILLADLMASPDDEVHGLAPRCFTQYAILPYERLCETIRAVVCDPAVQSLRPEPPMVDPIHLPTPDADDTPILYADIYTAAV